MRRMMALLAGAGLALALSGCGETKVLGGRKAPDETQVVDGPNLVLPPNFDLRPPRQADNYESILQQQKNAEARKLIAGQTAAVSATAPAGADQWLLNQAGRVDENIRTELDKDDAVDVAKEQDVKKKRFWSGWFSSSDDEE